MEEKGQPFLEKGVPVPPHFVPCLSLFLSCEVHDQMTMPTYENHLQKQNQLIAYDSLYSEGHPKSHKVRQGQK